MDTQAYQQAQFILSAAKLEQLPPDEGIEVAFIGRSNSGKSSAINAITNRKQLAKTSKTPGRTQLINLFQLNDNCRLVDLPGYGFAKVSVSIKQRWQENIQHYLECRHCLQGLVLMMDIRHPLTPMDQTLIQWAISAELPVHILLTKADKLKRGPANSTLLSVKKELSTYGNLVSIQLFSAVKKQGIEAAHEVLDRWFAGRT